MAITRCVMLIMILSVLECCKGIQVQPEQIHLSATERIDEMMVTWSTFNDTEESLVKFGNNLTLSMVAKGTSTKFIDGGSEKRAQFIHRVKLSGLKPAEIYYYHCGSAEGWSPLFIFQTFPSGTEWSPRFAVYGDMGNENAQSLSRLQEDVQQGMYHSILHVGDFAYDMENDNARVGDKFMRQIESIAAYLPYMTATGNHEYAYNFSNYKNRFTMPNFKETANLWYSWDVGPAHIISFSTEVYFFVYYGLFLINHQLEWLKQDLEAASKNRAERPWIITMGHRPMYCSNTDDDDCTKANGGFSLIGYELEELFYSYGVDVELWAHEHTYERLLPVYKGKVMSGSADAPYTNPKAPVHIITGSAGCKERHDPFTPTPAPWDGFRSQDYGYTRMTITNRTHLYLEQVSDDKNGKIIDDIWIIKEKHGPEAWN
ncbi:acid phosphatase type 7-like isoform X2 [Anneissia japonica]|uniref:acid phosphatase type 7-like isoform X2 n=1 Tax=Anneissia japonica TaxID=1529436 RepID=UPI0014257C29|nr:acid phosphatase type 7-like isoform X2 [Anneissia japonica]